MSVKQRKWYKAMEPRRKQVFQAGADNDVIFLRTLGGIEQSTWHEGRKSIDPNHLNPYSSEDRQKYESQISSLKGSKAACRKS